MTIHRHLIHPQILHRTHSQQTCGYHYQELYGKNIHPFDLISNLQQTNSLVHNKIAP